MTVHYPDTQAELNTIIQQQRGNLIVIDFTATWCGPCKAIKPKIHELAKQTPNVIFIEIDVDDSGHESTVAGFGVSAMPTFVFIRNGAVVGQVVGANLADIVTKVKSL
jgi:thioredoxin 1